MKLREIKTDERPLCPQCKIPLKWVRTIIINREVCGWEYDCECVDIYRLRPDEIDKFGE